MVVVLVQLRRLAVSRQCPLPFNGAVALARPLVLVGRAREVSQHVASRRHFIFLLFVWLSSLGAGLKGRQVTAWRALRFPARIQNPAELDAASCARPVQYRPLPCLSVLVRFTGVDTAAGHLPGLSGCLGFLALPCAQGGSLLIGGRSPWEGSMLSIQRRETGLGEGRNGGDNTHAHAVIRQGEMHMHASEVDIGRQEG